MFFYSCITGLLTTVIPCSSIASVSLNVPQMHLLVCSGYSESFCSNYQRPKQRQIIIIIMAKNYGENDYSEVQKNSTHSPPIIFGNFLCLAHFYNATLPTLLHFQIYFLSSRWFFIFFWLFSFNVLQLSYVIRTSPCFSEVWYDRVYLFLIWCRFIGQR